jgi:hypothetical protein
MAPSRYVPGPGAVAFLAVLATAAVLSAPSAGAVSYVDCAGSVRADDVPLEAQGWWTSKSGGDDFGHVHITVCAPLRKTLRDVASVDVQVVLHENPGTLLSIIARGHDGTGRDVKLGGYTLPTPLPGDPVGDVVFQRRLSFDVRGLDDNRSCADRVVCYQELRIKAIVAEPHTRFSSAPAGSGGDHMQPIVRFPVRIHNAVSAGVSDFSDGHVEGVAWYTGTGYAEAHIRDYPVGPVSDGWTPRLRSSAGACSVSFALSCPANNGFGPYPEIRPTGSLPIAWWSIHVDPNFHMGDNGCVVATKDTTGLPGEFGYADFPLGACMPPAGSGWHKLVFRVHEPDVNSAGSARLSNNKALLVVHFQR